MKRLFDLTLTLVLLPLWLGLLIVVYGVIFFNSGAGVIFTQARGGKGNSRFNIYKLRTMNNDKDSNAQLLSDEQRTTKLGAFLRKTSLDELPSLFNVLKGDMSLVGPRPFIADYLPLYNAQQRRRHNVRPGVTGWAQINGRNAISWQQKFDLDLWYVDNHSFWLDLKILWLTGAKVFKRQDVNASPEQTMARFNGNGES